jgi:hypothetical protein
MNYTIKWGIMLLISPFTENIDIEKLKGIIAGILFVGIILSNKSKKR